MKERIGNLWDTSADCHVFASTRAVERDSRAGGAARAILSSGSALTAARLFPGIDRALGKDILERGRRSAVLLVTPDGRDGTLRSPFGHIRCVAAAATRMHAKMAPNLDLIRESAAGLVTLADTFNWKTVVLPRLSCGKAPERWRIGGVAALGIRALLAEILDDRFIAMTYEAVA